MVLIESYDFNFDMIEGNICNYVMSSGEIKKLSMSIFLAENIWRNFIL